MTIGDRIKAKREELGYTQEELALKLGYKSRSSVNKMEKSRELPLKKVKLMAEMFGCSPGYLMGWEEGYEEKLEARRKKMMSYNMIFFEKQLLNNFNKLSDENKKKVIDYSSKILDIQSIESENYDMINAAHQRTDIEIPDGIDTSDDEFFNEDN